MKIFESHAHYNDEKFDEDRNIIIEENYKKGITGIICAGYSIESSKKALEISSNYNYIWATCGISPNDIEKNVEKEIAKIEEMSSNPKAVAIGEIGLDYYWNKDNKEIQKKIFAKQIQIANALNLPIVIHTRDAVMDTLNILKEYPVKMKGVFHCCPLNMELVKEALKLGFYISFSGIITFKNAKAEDIIKYVPNDKFLIETDSPYLSPEPNRGKRNDSSNLIYIIEKIASIKNMKSEEIAKISYENTKKLFKI